MRRTLIAAVLALVAAGCGSSTAGSANGRDGGPQTLTISAIPDQDPQVLARLYPAVADVLSDALGVPVRYRPVTDYAAVVTAFSTADLDAVWFGGLTGVQAMQQVPGARPLAQRDIDARFRSVFVASTASGLAPVSDVRGLRALRGRRFTFGSESSTSGRLMPQLFLQRAGIDPDEDFRGTPGFSGGHDRTIALVSSGSYDAGALNEQVWRERVEAGEVDPSKVRVIWRTPPYHDYFWVARPDLDERFGAGFTDRLRDALLALGGEDPRERRVLDLFGAERFVPVGPDDHDDIRAVARRLGLLGDPAR
jgi:phosphonate transport system substrate-binding protein